MKRFTASLRKTPTWTPASKRACLLGLLLLGLSALSLCFGSYPIRLFSGTPDERQMALTVFFKLRLPRVLAGILAGGVLGVTGAICQTVFTNPLASPDITGVASGATFGAAGAILLGAVGFLRAGFAFLGGVGALAILIFLVRLSGSAGAERRSRYLLAGVLVSSAANAGVMVLKTVADPERELAAIEFWTMGSFASMTAAKFLVMAVCALPPLVLLFLFSDRAVILSRGREEARAVGVSPAVWQTLLLLLCTFAVASVVSTVGVIGFIGLIVPHMALSLGKVRGRSHLTLCALLGGVLTVSSDLLARTLSPGAELPVSIFCTAFAVLWFGWIFCTGRTMGGDTSC